jgi:hypothetical protein
MVKFSRHNSKGHVAVVNSLIAKGENVDAATNVSTQRRREQIVLVLYLYLDC